ncbi:MAG TPA: ATP-grasp domain-containing protein [Candidatus Limnocylindrales bacterium]|jgi:biotin carboxylase|nr:ATP-grasp domain-containing protein [Candidatus Limnocylindrales bacterium]
MPEARETGRRLLVLGASPAQLGLLAAARERGLFVIALDRDPTAPGFRFADRRAIISTEDEQGIERLASAESVDGIIAPGIDWPVGVAARVAEKLGLPHPISPAVGTLAVSKQKQREALANAGVPQPAWHVVSEAEDGLPVPSVVKAPDRQGQKGLTLVRSGAELPEAIARAIEESRSGTAIIEELVEGPEVTVNAFSLRGEFHPLTVTDRLTAEPPAFGVALAHVWPSETGATAAAVAEKAVKALGIENGPSYTQLRIGPDGPQVIEVAARLGGGHDAELVQLALGVDLNGLALQAALGETIWSAALQPTPEAGGAIVRFLVPPAGTLQEVEGVEEAGAVEGVQDVRVYREPGHVFGRFLRGADRAGAVLAVGDSRDEALERADEAVRLIRFKVGAETLV